MKAAALPTPSQVSAPRPCSRTSCFAFSAMLLCSPEATASDTSACTGTLSLTLSTCSSSKAFTSTCWEDWGDSMSGCSEGRRMYSGRKKERGAATESGESLSTCTVPRG
ncbi:MAG: hypothetical protein HYW07_04895 [Candidatus Latescibacteria bacterium]|nr:hypothetical protein [Candidatus Latescibacterota bacterium]